MLATGITSYDYNSSSHRIIIPVNNSVYQVKGNSNELIPIAHELVSALMRE